MAQSVSPDSYNRNVLLFKYDDVVRRNGEVYTPHNMRMSELRRSEQFKRGVVFTKDMTESDVRNKLEELFPILRGKR